MTHPHGGDLRSSERRAIGPTPLKRSDRFYCRVTLRCVIREKCSPDLPVPLAIGPIIPVESNFDGDYVRLYVRSQRRFSSPPLPGGLAEAAGPLVVVPRGGLEGV